MTVVFYFFFLFVFPFFFPPKPSKPILASLSLRQFYLKAQSIVLLCFNRHSLVMSRTLIMSQARKQAVNISTMPGDTMFRKLCLACFYRFVEQSVLLQCCCQLLILPFNTLH